MYARIYDTRLVAVGRGLTARNYATVARPAHRPDRDLREPDAPPRLRGDARKSIACKKQVDRDSVWLMDFVARCEHSTSEVSRAMNVRCVSKALRSEETSGIFVENDNSWCFPLRLQAEIPTRFPRKEDRRRRRDAEKNTGQIRSVEDEEVRFKSAERLRSFYLHFFLFSENFGANGICLLPEVTPRKRVEIWDT